MGYDHLYNSFSSKIPYRIHNLVTLKLTTKLPKNISNKNGILFGCGITTAFGSLMGNINKKNINSKKILLTGFGMIGQIMLALMNALKILDITVIENNNNKLRMLKKKL